MSDQNLYAVTLLFGSTKNQEQISSFIRFIVNKMSEVDVTYNITKIDIEELQNNLRNTIPKYDTKRRLRNELE